MLTMSPELPCTRRLPAIAGGIAAITATLIGLSPAQAGGIQTDDCLSSPRGSSCTQSWSDGLANPYVIEVPQPTSEEEIAGFEERDRLWRARCNPVVKQDMYGVSRYSYSAPGCDYGKYE
jgi:hypothetical protein